MPDYAVAATLGAFDLGLVGMAVRRKHGVSDDLQQALKTRASSEGISATELVNRLLRQGLAADTAPAEAGDALQQRVSQLEQVLHQLERRMLAQVVGDRDDHDVSTASDPKLGGRLLALEQKLDALTTGVEESCRHLKQLYRAVLGVSTLGLPAAPGQSGPHLSTPAPTTYPEELSEQVVQMPLATLRKLLADQPD